MNSKMMQVLTLLSTEEEKMRNLLEDEVAFDQMLQDALKEHLPNPRQALSIKRHRFWEEYVPQHNDAFFKENFRMEPKSFKILYKQFQEMKNIDESIPKTIPLDKCIAIALYTLGTSAAYRTVGRRFGVSTSTVYKILMEFCRKVIIKLAAEFLPAKFITQSKIEECVRGFEAIGLPQSFAAIDACHIEVRPTSEESAEDHYNNMGWHSVMLLALVDYRFLYLNFGYPGRYNKSQIFENSKLKKVFETNTLLQQNVKEIANTDVPVVILGDAAFQLSKSLMKPYTFVTKTMTQQKYFNPKINEATSLAENALAELKARFRRVAKGLDDETKDNVIIIMCCCILHNFLKEQNSKINENWQKHVQNSPPQPEYTANCANDLNFEAEKVREAISKYLTKY